MMSSWWVIRYDLYRKWKPWIWILLWLAGIPIPPRDAALELFENFPYHASDTPPRGRIGIPANHNKIQIKGFHFRYESYRMTHHDDVIDDVTKQ